MQEVLIFAKAAPGFKSKWPYIGAVVTRRASDNHFDLGWARASLRGVSRVPTEGVPRAVRLLGKGGGGGGADATSPPPIADVAAALDSKDEEELARLGVEEILLAEPKRPPMIVSITVPDARGAAAATSQ